MFYATHNRSKTSLFGPIYDDDIIACKCVLCPAQPDILRSMYKMITITIPICTLYDPCDLGDKYRKFSDLRTSVLNGAVTYLKFMFVIRRRASTERANIIEMKASTRKVFG